MVRTFRLIRSGTVIVLAAAVAGCMGEPDAPDPSLTVNRANWVQSSIVRDMSIETLGEPGLIGIVADDGGGYVTRITITGQPGTFSQRTVMDTVLGTSLVRDPPFGLEVNSGGNIPQVVLCFRFTIGWVDTMVPPPVRESCPESAGRQPTLADEEAGKIQAAANLAAVVGTPQSAVPGGREAAVKLLESHGTYALKVLAGEGVRQPGMPDLAYALSRLSFASGDGVAAAAMPVLGGGCVYETFTRGDPPGGANPTWPAPLDDPCTAIAALAISRPLSYNPQAGG
jgi:hypothetical protein